MGVASLVAGLKNWLSKMNGRNELIFCMLVQIQKMSAKMSPISLVQETLKLAAVFFARWLLYNNFLLDQHRSLYMWLLSASLLQLYLLDPQQ